MDDLLGLLPVSKVMWLLILAGVTTLALHCQHLLVIHLPK